MQLTGSKPNSTIHNVFKRFAKPKNSLYQSAFKIQWYEFEKEFSKHCANEFGRPAKPIRLIVQLQIFKQLGGLGDEKVVEKRRQFISMEVSGRSW